MTATVTIDKAGRVVIPKEIRDELRLEAGDTLAVESEGERVTLRPVRVVAPLHKERGVWVFHGGKPLSLDEANQLLRDTRETRGASTRGTQKTSRGLVRKSPAA
jgi:AbrB family looped-hinge helix DNA binding protein